MPADSIATLTRLLEHAEGERDAAQAALQQAEAAARAAQTQADELTQYRGEYRQRWSTHFRRPDSIALLHCVQGFGQRLDQAIDQQRRNAEQADERVRRARALLLAREQRVAAVGKLIERRQAELRRSADRRDQRATDEAALRVSAAARQATAQP